MTKEQIQERIELLKAEKDKLIATVQVYNGALQECQYWLTVLEQENKTE